MKKIYTALLCCCVLISIQGFSQTWNGSVSKDWNTADNWTPSGVPSTSGNIVINNASAPNQPVMAGNVSIRTLNMSAGSLNLKGYTLTCSVSATLTGDSLYNGTISSATFNNLANMRMVGKIILDKTGASNEFWQGKNKFNGDSLIIIWRTGGLSMENAAASPDSIFGNLKLVYSDNNETTYRISIGVNSPIWIQNDLILDNPDKGTFGLDNSSEKIIEGSIKAIDFSSAVPNFPLVNVTALGSNANGPFYAHTGSIDNCRFNGNFSFVADSNITVNIMNSSFLGANNLLQAGGLWTHDNKFGQAGTGTTILRAAFNGSDPSVRLRGGNNKFFGNAQWETFATWPGGITIEHTFFGPDTTVGNLGFIMKGNASLVTNSNGHNYVGGDLIIDGKGNSKWIQFTGGTGNTYNIGGSFTVKNFSPNLEPGVPAGTGIDVLLRNISANGSDTCGTFYCFTGDINNCSFNGGLKMIADSSQTFTIVNSSLRGADNLIRSGGLVISGSQFGQAGRGSTLLQATYNGGGAAYFRDGNNKFFGDVNFEGSAVAPGGTTIHHTYIGQDTCLGNLNFVLKGNVALISNMNGNNYVGGNVTIDGQGHRKYVEFTGGNGISFTVGGHFTAKNFDPSAEPGVDHTNVHLRNLTVAGTDTCGTFYCYTGDINNCSFEGNFKLIGDSSQTYYVFNSSLRGANNLFQSGSVEVNNSLFGQTSVGTTLLRGAYNGQGSAYMRDGNNKFLGNVNFETFAVYPGGITLQQTYYGQDTCLANMNYILKGNSVLTTNGNGHSYVAGNVTIDGQGARKWVLFPGGDGISFTVGGNFTAKNFTPFSETGAGPTNVQLHNLNVSGSDTCGTFYCLTGDIINSNFNGNFRLIGDSAYTYFISNSSFLGPNNFLQAGALDIQASKFGRTGPGTTILRSALNNGVNAYMRDGSCKFFGNVNFETFAPFPGSVTIQQNYYGVDSCLGNMDFVLKGNTALTTNGNGNNYVAGNVTIDGQGARKWIQFTGGAGNTFNVGGYFTVKNFAPYSEPGVGGTNVHLRNLFVTGSDTVGTFYCYTGDITNCGFNGNFRLIADSSQPYSINTSSLLGADNLFRSGNLDIQNSKFGRIGTGTTVLDIAHNVAAPVYVRDGGNKFLGDLHLNAVAPSYGSILVQQTYYGAADTCLGNFTLNISGLCSANLAGNNLYIGKELSLVNNGSGVIVHDNAASAIHFIGADTANYFFSGSGSSPSFINIEMNRKGGLRLMSPLSYTGTLQFTRGIILSSVSNPLQIPNGAVVTSAWDSSYVDGPVRKTGNTLFTFPLGKNNVYAPISITPPSSATDAFTAQYSNHLAHLDGYDTTQHDFSLNHLSRREYWALNRVNGTSAVNVTLSWNAKRSGIVNAMTDLRVAHWNGTTWKDEGNGGTTGDNSRGSILSLNTINSFSPFTLASIGISNPLPVIFTSFDVQLQKERMVLIRWTTSNEINNDHFEVLRSNDLVTWTNLQAISPDISGVYAWVDKNATDGMNYYRIKQVDADGNNLYTQIKLINVQTDNSIFLWPNPVINELHLRLPFVSGIIDITDEGGKVLLTRIIDSNNIMVSVRQFKAGVYFVRIKAGEVHQARKFVKI